MISKHDALIGYVSFGDEPDPYKIFQLKSLTKLSVVPKDSHTDPFVMADMFTKIYDNKNVCVLVPGTRFDIFGNRKGRGGGWYDRFLATIPKEWTRIGIIDESRLSPKRLNINSWDEPMDWIFSVGRTVHLFCCSSARVSALLDNKVRVSLLQDKMIQ